MCRQACLQPSQGFSASQLSSYLGGCGRCWEGRNAQSEDKMPRVFAFAVACVRLWTPSFS
jgi:hypothetical protein